MCRVMTAQNESLVIPTQVSLLDYFPGSEPKVGVTFSAGGCSFFVLQDKSSDLLIERDLLSQADTEGLLF